MSAKQSWADSLIKIKIFHPYSTKLVIEIKEENSRGQGEESTKSEKFCILKTPLLFILCIIVQEKGVRIV